MSRRRLAWAIAIVLIVLVACIAVIDPSDLAWSRGFMILGSGTGHDPPIALGDHLQTSYYAWLWWDSIATRSHLPVIDPFQFVMTGHRTHELAGWPLVLVFVPVTAVAGPIAAYNFTLIASFLAAALCMYLLVRALGLSRPAGLVAGFAYAFAPFRMIQITHTGALIAFLLPLLLYLAEKAIRGERNNARWAWGCTLAFGTLVCSGDFHLALFGAGLFVVFVIVRAKDVPREKLRPLIPAAVALVVGSAFATGVIYHYVLAPSGRHSRGIAVAHDYAPKVRNLYDREHGTEAYAYPGLVIFALAVLGTIRTWRYRPSRAVVGSLAVLTLVSYAVAMAPGFSPTFKIYRLLPFVGFIRVPGRVLIVAVVALAVLAGYGAAFLKESRRGIACMLVLLALIALDAKAPAYSLDYTSAGRDVLAKVPKGAPVMDLPPFTPDHHGASRYMLDLMRHPGPRANGYYVLAPEDVWKAQAETWVLARVPVEPCSWKGLVKKLNFEYVAIHTDLFGGTPFWPIRVVTKGRATAEQLLDALDHTAGFHRVSNIDGTVVYQVVLEELQCAS